MVLFSDYCNKYSGSIRTRNFLISLRNHFTVEKFH